jgi:hypothetical protein
VKVQSFIFALATAGLVSTALADDYTAQQQHMIDCNHQAHGMVGDERKAFMYKCLRGDPATAAPAVAPAPEPSTPKKVKPIAAPTSPKPTGPSQWNYSSLSDPMTSKETPLAQILSTNTVSLSFPYQGEQKMRLTLRAPGGRFGAAAMIQITKGQFQCSVYSCPVMLRVDDRPAVTLTGSESADHDSTIVFLPYARVVKMVTGARTLAIAPTFFQNGSPVVMFNVENFDPSKLQPSKVK